MLTMTSMDNEADSPSLDENKITAEAIGSPPVTPTRPVANVPVVSGSTNASTTTSTNPMSGSTIAWRGGGTTPASSPTSPNSSTNMAVGSPHSSPMRSSTGLSELSKQLRALQAQNDAKNAEIDRLTRQIKILADLQGVSVANLRKALDDACEAAALAELQSRVAGLKAQLEAATAVRDQGTQGGAGGKTIQEDVMAKKVANLELKVGELEELEERQRNEKRDLFNRLREKTDEMARLEAQILHLSSENERLNKEKEQTPAFPEANAVFVPTDESSKEVGLQEHDGNRNAEVFDYLAQIAALEAKLRQAEAELQSTREKLSLSDEQKHSEGEQEKLRNAQFKARFIVQEDNIRDLEQQLSSLYTAFTLLREERDQEEQERLALQVSLGQADAAVARLHDHEGTVSATATRLSSLPQRNTTAATNRKQRSAEMVPVVSLQLWVRGTGNFRKWKKQPAVLYSTMSHHILDLGTGKTYNIYYDLAKLSNHRLQVFGFTIHLNPDDPQAPELWLAASNREEHITWMEALKQATKESSQNADQSFSSQQEELELERALKLSEEEK